MPFPGIALNTTPHMSSPAPTILVVDDDPDLRDALAMVLKDEGYSILPFANGLEALDHLRTDPSASLIVLDLMMPVMNGWKFYEEKAQNPLLADIPVVVVSAYADRAPPSATTVLKKPLRTSDLLAAVARELSGGAEETSPEVLQLAERMWNRLHSQGAGAARVPWNAANPEVRREMIALARGVLIKPAVRGPATAPSSAGPTILWILSGDSESAAYGSAGAAITRLPDTGDGKTRVRVTSHGPDGTEDSPVELEFPPGHLDDRIKELKEHLRLEMVLRSSS
jgi:two-component system chemotaxis response regulator CheY